MRSTENETVTSNSRRGKRRMEIQLDLRPCMGYEVDLVGPEWMATPDRSKGSRLFLLCLMPNQLRPDSAHDMHPWSSVQVKLFS